MRAGAAITRSKAAVMGLIVGGMFACGWAATAWAQETPEIDHSQTAAAAKQVHQAGEAVSQARVRINRLRNSVRAELQAKAEWAPVFSDLKTAQAQCDEAKKAVLARLGHNPKYQALRRERETAQQTTAAADAGDSTVSDSQIDQATQVIFNDGLKLKQMETAALENDLKYTDAKAVLDAARAKVDQFDEEVTAALERTPEYQQLRQSLDSAEQQLQSARQQLAQAAQAERDAREQAERSREEQAANGQAQ